MNNSKLINILRTFSKSEMKEFEKFISSSYFNRGRNYTPFLSQLKKFHPRFDNDKLTSEYLYSKVYPGKKFNKQVMWNMSSALYNLAEEFLTFTFLKKNSFIKNSHINDELYYRKLGKIYRKKLDVMGKELDEIGLSNYYFQFKIQLESDKINYHFLEDNQHLVHIHIAAKGEYIILNFLRSISEVISDMNSNIGMFNARFDLNLPFEFIKNLNLDNIIAYARGKKYKDLNIMEMYYCSIMVAVNPNEVSYFFRLKELLEKNSGKFETDEKDSLLTLLANYCSEKINNNEDNYRNTLFEINQLQLKEIEKFRKRDLGKILYLQTLRNALSIGEIKWAKAYIEKYTAFLKHSYQKSQRALANSFLFFKLKDYNNVIENLGKVRFIDVRDKFHVKSLYIKTYYELGEFPALHYQIDSAKQFISKNSGIAKYTRTNFTIFLTHMTQFMHFLENNNFTEIEMLKRKIEQEESFTNHNWLLEKINEIKKGAL